jgi:hypothetical protein
MLKEAISKGTFFCSNAAFVRNVWKDWKLVGRYNFFKELLRIIDIVSGEINLPQKHCGATFSQLRIVDSDN